jgi:glycosyltransferase involved in cell wall biosynthesis
MPRRQSTPEVLIAAGCPHATVTRYRCLHLQEQLAANGVQALVEEWYDLDRIDPQLPLPQTALFLQRVAYTPALGQIIDRMHAAGRPVLFDVDDLVFEPQLAAWHRGAATLPLAEQELYVEGVRRYQATLRACDRVLTASPLLAELAQRHGVAADVHRNALGAEMTAWASELHALRRQRQAQGNDGPLVLGYGSGTPTHDVDFAEAAGAVIDILTRYPRAELWIAGPMQLPEALNAFGARVRRFPLLGWREWFELLAQVDINLAPLEMGNVFCRAKSEIKFVEAAALGIPTVASQIDPFAAAIRHGENGYLAANLAEWMEHLNSLAADVALRRRIGAAARATALARYGPDARTADLAGLLPALWKKHTAMTAEKNAEMHTWPGTVPDTSRDTAPDTVHDISSISASDSASDSAQAARTGTGEPKPFVPLTVHWLVSEPIAGSGGHTGIFRMIRHLVDFGHTCHVHMIPVNFMHGYTPAQIQQHVDDHFLATGAVYHQWDGRMGAADATVATFWRTVPPLLKLPMPGKRYYLVQDFEPFFYPMGVEYIEAENSYRQGLHCLTLGPWLAKLMREQYGAAADHFDFAVDTQVYYPTAAARPAHPRVVFYARPSTPRRAYELGVEALQLVKQQNPGVEIIFFGSETLPPPPFPITNAGLLNPWELARLFSSCDVGIVFSTTNPSFVPFEMMACRCAVVDLASERVAGLLEDRVNCCLAAPAPESIASAVLNLVANRALREGIIEQAYVQVKDRSWEHSARQIEAVLLRHTPPEQRVAYQATSGDDLDMLAWQIHQLLDAGGDNTELVDALRATLYRTLAEKAALVEHVRQVEEQLAQATGGTAAGAPAGAGLPAAPVKTVKVKTALQPLADKLFDGAPAWRLGGAILSKLPVDQEPLRQAFVADRSHLRRIELRLAPHAPVHTGTLRVSLYADDEHGRLVASELLRVGEIDLAAPWGFDLAPQPDSYGKRYLLCVAMGEVNRQPPALWHFRQAQLADAQLWHGSHPLGGQLALQPFYGERPPLLPPRQGIQGWNEPVQFAPAIARELAAQQSQEVRRLAGQARTALQQRGLGGLVREVLNYVQWQLTRRG